MKRLKEKGKHFSASLLVMTLLAACTPYRVHVIETPETRGLKGWQKPYTVNGELYEPLLSYGGFVQDGVASWYGDDAHGGPTSSGEVYDMYALTAAHKTLPMGVYVRVHNRLNDKEVVVRINDRGPFVKERIIDLSYAAARHLGIVESGTAPVHIKAMGYQSDSTAATASRTPVNDDAGTFAVQVAAFGSQDNARQLADLMKKQHSFVTLQETMVKGSRLFRVRVGKYQSLTQAEEARRNFERDGYRGCFVVSPE